MEILLSNSRGDDRLLALGADFDRAFERYLWLISETNRVRKECEERLPLFGVTPDDATRWNRVIDNACAAWQDNAREAGADAEAISRQIAAIPATTVAGILVKARCLPFDIVERSDEDRQTELLHAFVDEVEAVAFGRLATC